MSRAVTMPMTMVVMVMRVVPVVVVVTPTIAPVWIPAPIGVIRIAPVIIPAPVVATPIGTVAITHIETRIIAPVEWVVAVAVDVVSIATSVVVVIITHRRGGSRTETLDASRIVGIVVGLGGGVNHAIGVGDGFCGLVNRISIADVVLAVGVISLVVILRIAGHLWIHIRAVVGGHVRARVTVGRVVNIVFGHVFA